MQLNFSGYKIFVSTLYCNNRQAFFNFKQNSPESPKISNDQADNQKVSFHVSDTATFFVASDIETGVTTELVRGFDKPFYFIREPLTEVNWVITDTTKMFDSYLCTKARCHFLGRNYVAWFSTDIPAFFGPWKLNNLPGLILEVSDDKGEVSFVAKKIATVQIPVDSVSQTADYTVISKKMYYQKINEYVTDLEKRLSTRAGREFKIKAKTPTIRTIEIYEE